MAPHHCRLKCSETESQRILFSLKLFLSGTVSQQGVQLMHLLSLFMLSIWRPKLHLLSWSKCQTTSYNILTCEAALTFVVL